MLHVRSEHPAFGLGEYVEVRASNPSVLAYLRALDAESSKDADVVLCVFNLSARPQPVLVDLSTAVDAELVELTGGESFGVVDKSGRVALTLPRHGFYWFAVRPREES